MNDDIIADIRARLNRCPVYIGQSPLALPAPDTVPEGTYVYPGAHWFMEAVRHEFWSINNYAVPAPPLGP